MQTKIETIVGQSIDGYDYVIFTDGSGTTYSNPSGFASYIFDVKSDMMVGPIKGGIDIGTNNFAEMMPFIISLYWIRNTGKYEPKKILLISDSEWFVKTLNGEYIKSQSHPLGLLWGAIEYSRLWWGYCIDAIHVGRNSNEYNKLCDKEAGFMRNQLVGL